MVNKFLSEKVKTIFELDLRSLALYRIGIACFTFGDLLLRAEYLKAHYTDWGVLPRSALIAPSFLNSWRISVHLMSGEAWGEALLFLTTAIFAFMLLAGFRTRLASFFVWFLTVSLQARNPMVLQGGDVLYRMALFFGMFLPLNGRFSVDCALDSSQEKKPVCVFSAGTLGFILQVIFVYWFSVGIKIIKPVSRQIWLTEGMAVYNALNVDQFTRAFGYFLLGLPVEVLKFLNYYSLGVEFFAPFLLLLPFTNGIARMVFIFLVGGLHAGMGAALSLGLFPFIGTVTLLPLVPGKAWDALGSFLSRHPPGGTVFFRRLVEKCIRRLPAAPLKLGLSLPAQIMAGFSIVYILFWNLGTLGLPYTIPPQLRGIGQTFAFDQYWDMFSPPMTDDGLYVIPARLRNGTEVDLFRKGRPIRWEKPRRVSWLYKNERWRKYMMNLWAEVNQGHRLYYGQYLCREWNSTHPSDQAVEEFQIFFMREDTAPYKSVLPHKTSIWRHFCFQVPEPMPPSKWES